ncbi:MAG: ABC transporter ATP-binding protein [Candidatus Margulisiibacteriota bacterium]|nr:ABC transporter ATP-binding protein [Candidatus Margulisiibacteriota bacterium]
MKNNSITKFQIIWYFIRQHPVYVLGIILLAFLASVFDGLNLAILFTVLSEMLPSGMTGTVGGSFIKFTEGLIGIVPIQDKMVASAVLLILSVVLKGVFAYWNVIYGMFAAYHIWADTQKGIFNKYISADYQFFLDHKQGELIYRIISAPSSAGAIFDYIPRMLTEIVRLAVVGLVLLNIHMYASIGIIVIGGLYYYLTKYIATNISYNLGKGRIYAGERMNVLANESVSGIRQIKVYNSQNRWVTEFVKAMKQYFNLARRDVIWKNLPKVLLESLSVILLAVLLIVVKLLLPTSYMSLLPILGVFAYAFQKVTPSMAILGNFRIQFMGILPTLELLYYVLHEDSNKIKDGEKEIKSFSEGIRFENVSFSYPGRDRVINKINSIFKKGETTAIVGSSGAGKSTIADLIVRVFVPQDGKILIDGIELNISRISSWLKKIGFVTQDTFIFNATIAENITFGGDTAEKMDEVVEAAKVAHAHEFISEFPDGYNTVVGDRGMKISGGQRQRIAIARAIYRKPEILIFDEATSALDNVSEKIIQQTINALSKDHTLIVIAHRLSTIINADKIIVLDKGKVIESGNHEELMEKGRHYWSLYNTQIKNTEKEGVGYAKEAA